MRCRDLRDRVGESGEMAWHPLCMKDEAAMSFSVYCNVFWYLLIVLVFLVYLRKGV